jgi:nuclear transport factor 2 (NTF2) superfamily protein
MPGTRAIRIEWYWSIHRTPAGAIAPSFRPDVTRSDSSWHDDSGQWFRSYGNENWEFNEHGLMQRRFASINDLPIKAAERKFFWHLGRRPDDHPGLSDLDL